MVTLRTKLCRPALIVVLSLFSAVFASGQNKPSAAIGDLIGQANRGDALARSKLGVMLELGQGVRQDYKEAAKWYRLAADQGYVYA
jgi:TPR repeat protein